MISTPSSGYREIPATESGFTLMETIVALVLFSSVFFVLYNGLAGGWRGVRFAASDTLAVRLARAKLAAAGVDSPLADGAEASGDEAGFEWRMEAHIYPQPDDAQTDLTAYWVTVEVSWQDAPLSPTRSLKLKTLKITHS